MESFSNNSEDSYTVSEDERDTVSDTASVFNLKRNNTGYLEEQVKNHVVVNTRNNDSSTESIKIKLNDINFDCYNKEVIDTNFFTLNNLESITFPQIYNIFNSTQMIIFVDNYKLNNINKKSYFSCFKSKKKMYEDEFPGCTFFPFEYVNQLKKDIHILNNNILNAELKNQKIYSKDDVCFSICFDEGEIFKDCLYKKMEIVDKILFVPINKYQLKQTEYKIRGFCQIVEELGAKKIQIKFQKNDNKISKSKIESSIGTDIELIAGSLGLSSKKTKSDNENYKYTLDYPNNNTILLNEKALKKKIKKKKFIISEDIYNSNLELQYVIRSRCRHFITKYSTVFTFDNTLSIDKNLITKFKAHNIDIGFSLETLKSKKYYLQIITDVKFSNQTDYCSNLNGYSVSLDKIGFSFLIDSLKNDANFEENGIYKIMVFINLYIEKVVKHSSVMDYDKIINVMKKIKKKLTIKEYAELLNNYFNNNSQWIHFTNFIDLLGNKTQSYDKLGYLIIMNQDDIALKEKIEILVRFIQERSILEKIEIKFWKMLQPHNVKLTYFLHDKLINEYDFVTCFNWFSLNSLIDNIREYVIDYNELNDEEIFRIIKNNMSVGYKKFEFINNMIPFILRQCQSMHYKSKNNYYLSSLLEASLNYESFTIAKIDSLNDLHNYINKKVNRIEQGYKMMEEIKIYLDNAEKKDYFNKINEFVTSDDFKKTYEYFNKKINLIVSDKKNLRKFLLDPECSFSIDNFIHNILKKLLLYNEKLSISNIPPNSFGFNLVLIRYNCGIKTLEFERLIKPFIQKVIKNLILDQFCSNSMEYQVLNDYDIFNKLDYVYFENNCKTYYNLLLNIRIIIKDETDINITDNILRCETV